MRKILSEQIREVPQSFGWIDRNLIHLGFLEEMTRHEFLLYSFLCLTCDRFGMSFWGVNKTARLLKISHNSLEEAREGLQEKGLVSFEKDEETGRIYYQVLPLPVDRMEVVSRARVGKAKGQGAAPTPKATQDNPKNKLTGKKKAIAKRSPLRSSDAEERRQQRALQEEEDEQAVLEVRRQIREMLKLGD